MYWEKQIGDVMVAVDGCPTLASSNSIREAVLTFKKRNAPVILVTDQEGRPKGLLTPSSILRAFQPRFYRSDFYSRGLSFLAEWIDPVFWEDLFVLRCRAEADRPVAEVMEEITAVDPDDPLLKAVYLMVTKGCDVLPVMRGGRLLGIVTTSVLFEEVCRIVVREAPPAYAGVMEAAG